MLRDRGNTVLRERLGENVLREKLVNTVLRERLGEQCEVIEIGGTMC